MSRTRHPRRQRKSWCGWCDASLAPERGGRTWRAGTTVPCHHCKADLARWKRRQSELPFAERECSE